MLAIFKNRDMVYFYGIVDRIALLSEKYLIRKAYVLNKSWNGRKDYITYV